MSSKIFDKKDSDLIKKKSEEVQNNLNSGDYFNQYIYKTLESFSFRYFDQPSLPEQFDINSLRVRAIEKGIKEAIKNKNPILRAGIGELVKRVSKEQGPTILRELSISFDNASGSGGVSKIRARISFGHPDHDFSEGTFVESLSIFKYEDEIHFRNNLAKYLEIVCELF